MGSELGHGHWEGQVGSNAAGLWWKSPQDSQGNLFPSSHFLPTSSPSLKTTPRFPFSHLADREPHLWPPLYLKRFLLFLLFFFPACFLLSFPPRPPLLLVFLTLPFLLLMESPPRTSCPSSSHLPPGLPWLTPAYKCARCLSGWKSFPWVWFSSQVILQFLAYPKPPGVSREGSLQVNLQSLHHLHPSAFQSKPLPPQTLQSHRGPLWGWIQLFFSQPSIHEALLSDNPLFPQTTFPHCSLYLTSQTTLRNLFFPSFPFPPSFIPAL